MAYRQSPGISVSEIDETLITSGVSSRVAAFAGIFNWGPVNYPSSVTTESDLVSQFGKPSLANNQAFFTAANYLAYTNNLLNVRIDANGQYNAVQVPKITVTGTVSVSTGTTAVTGVGSAFLTNVAVGETLITIPAGATTYTTIGTIESITDDTHLVLAANYTGSTLTGEPVYIDNRLVIKNEDDYHSNYESGAANVGQFAARYPGKLGDSIQIFVLDNATFQSFTGTGTLSGSSASATLTIAGLTSVDYLQPGYILYETDGTQIGVIKRVVSNTSVILTSAPLKTLTTATYKVSIPAEISSLFTQAPSTSNFALNKGFENALDEVHVVVVDRDGKITGTRNAILEKYAFLSKLQDAKDESNTSIYYKNVINNQSKWIWWLDLPTTSEINSSGISWGVDLTLQTDQTASVKSLKYPNVISLSGGFDADAYPTTTARDADKIQTLQILNNKELYDFQAIFLCQATTTVANAAIAIAELRKDCVVFISPEHTDGNPIEGTGTAAVNKILAYRSGLPSTSYAFLDSGYKEQLDTYNDKKIKVPLNGDVAGLNAAATEIQPWNTPAGFNNGQLKNTNKLLFNPTEQDRDVLYPKGVNSVVSFKAQGTVLYGDKTLLSKPSAFDRLETRNLFIFLEKSIANFAKYYLFEINDSFTRSQFKNAVDPFLRNIKGNCGIYDFLVVCDETNNTPSVVETNNFAGKILIKPQYRINFIDLSFVGTRQSVSFTTGL